MSHFSGWLSEIEGLNSIHLTRDLEESNTFIFYSDSCKMLLNFGLCYYYCEAK